MNTVILFFQWYFFEVPRTIKKFWGNYLWFFPRLFSLGRMVKELFLPWKGLTFKREKRAFELGDAFSAMFGNFISSAIGMCARIFFIIIGLAVELLAVFAGVAAYAGWILLIPAIIYFSIAGFVLLF